MRNRLALTFTFTFLAVLLAFPAFAHVPSSGLQGGFISGYIHPLSGWDHVAAMIAVGIWGALIGGRAIWVLPIVFPFVMVIGGILGMIGVPIPFIVPGIAFSSIVIGMAIFFHWKPQLWITAVMVGVFAIFHGYAHGQNLPSASNPIAFALGFVLGSGTLHLIGITFGFLDQYKWGVPTLRAAGILIALVGGAVLFGLI